MDAADFIVKTLSSMYAHSSAQYDRSCKTLHSKLSSNEGKSRIQGRGKSSVYNGLLTVLAVFCLVDIGEARWFGEANEMIDNVNVEEVGMQVSVLFFVYT